MTPSAGAKLRKLASGVDVMTAASLARPPAQPNRSRAILEGDAVVRNVVPMSVLFL
jgi:hypothetical protein